MIEELGDVGAAPHLDAIRFIGSAGTWSPDGRRFAFASFAEGDNELSIWNVESGRIERNIRIDGVTALTNPAWSPNGREVACLLRAQP